MAECHTRAEKSSRELCGDSMRTRTQRQLERWSVPNRITSGWSDFLSYGFLGIMDFYLFIYLFL
jgi:hypothetical protein